MKKFLFLTTAFVICLLATDRVFAVEPEGCTNCEEPWSPPITVTYGDFGDCEGCVVSVTYLKKELCKEIFLISITIGNNMCQPCIGTPGYEYLMREVWIRLLKQGPFTPTEEGRQIIVKITQDACWSTVRGEMTRADGLYPCNTNVCCVRRYNVGNTQGVPYCVYLGGESAEIDCSLLGCYNICELEWYPRINIETQPDQLKESAATTTISPNPAVDMINVSISATETGKAQFRLYNETGIEVINKEIPKSGENLSFSLDLKKAVPGLFVYKVFINNKVVSSGKMIISQ